jgi:hypothetical protein
MDIMAPGLGDDIRDAAMRQHPALMQDDEIIACDNLVEQMGGP